MSVEGAYNFAAAGQAVLADFSGFARHGDLTGSAGVQTTGGRYGPALGKTGAAMPVLPSSLLTAMHAATDRALCFWASGVGTTWWVRFQADVAGDGTGTFGALLLAGNMAGQVRDAAQNLAARPQASGPAVGEQHWYCLTYTRATGSIDLYRDNVLISPGPPDGHSSFAAGTALSTAAEAINLLETSDPTSRLSELRFLSHVPDATERQALMDTPIGATVAGVKIWTGSSWADTPPTRRHDGTTWQLAPAAHVL
ncbi:hypothetical protein [Amycolatopsis tolypomycina]|uniref:hypothetical protein n=1 Tax=Amycolatopsis tolypomycina TaxID=208445 RepID=UPI0033B8A4A3